MRHAFHGAPNYQKRTKTSISTQELTRSNQLSQQWIKIAWA